MRKDLKMIMEIYHSDEAFKKAYIKYNDIKKVKSEPAKTGKQIFSWKKKKFNHISVGGNKVDYLVYNGIVICSFPLKKDRNEIYEFIQKYWTNTIEPFIEYIDKRKSDG